MAFFVVLQEKPFFMPINSYIQYLEVEKRYSPHTIKSYTNDLSQFNSFVENEIKTLITHVTQHDIRLWIIQLRQNKISPKSVNRKITCLRSFYKYLQITHLVEKNPTTYIKLLKTDKLLPSYVEEENMDELFASILKSDTYKGKLDKLIFFLLYDTGIRVSELINLKIVDIDSQKLQIKVLGKRNKERVIPISISLVKEIEEYIVWKQRDVEETLEPKYLLHTERGKKLYPKLVYRTINYYLSRVTTITKKSPHVIRHTFATHLLNKGAELNAIKDLLGHASLSATQIYTHNSIEQLKEIYKKAHPKA